MIKLYQRYQDNHQQKDVGQTNEQKRTDPHQRPTQEMTKSPQVDQEEAQPKKRRD